MFANFGNPVHRFRIVALIEGISFLMIFGISLPLKYIFTFTTLPYIIGLTHGLLFVVYVILAFEILIRRRVNGVQFARILVASIIPFGTFFNDKMLRVQEQKAVCT